MPVSGDPEAFKPGDIVSWSLTPGGFLPHIGIVSSRLGDQGVPLVVHNIGAGPQLEDALFAWQITGHYRFLNWPQSSIDIPWGKADQLRGRELTLVILKVLAALIAGYLLGSLNSAIIVGRLYGKDIRSHGSKSAGLTNALRVLGKPAAGLVLVGDILKGVLACLIGLQLGVDVQSGEATDSLSLLAAGAGAVIGHNWPVYFGFRGGKGMLTAAAVMLMFDWVMTLSSFGLFVAVVALTRYVSLGTICAVMCFVALSFLPVFETTWHFNTVACLLGLVIIFKHRENMQRLLSGTENRLTF
jgi:glycerol-3-phosphate acyltransferase PlsY